MGHPWLAEENEMPCRQVIAEQVSRWGKKEEQGEEGQGEVTHVDGSIADSRTLPIGWSKDALVERDEKRGVFRDGLGVACACIVYSKKGLTLENDYHAQYK